MNLRSLCIDGRHHVFICGQRCFAKIGNGDNVVSIRVRVCWTSKLECRMNTRGPFVERSIDLTVQGSEIEILISQYRTYRSCSKSNHDIRDHRFIRWAALKPVTVGGGERGRFGKDTALKNLYDSGVLIWTWCLNGIRGFCLERSVIGETRL